MPHKLSRFTQSLVYEPQFITQPLLEEVTNYLEDRNFGNYVKAHEEATKMASADSRQPEVSDNSVVGMLRVSGNLTYKPTIFSALCGGTDYTTLIEQTKELVAMPELSTIVMEVDSGGGLAFRMMETSREIRKLCRDNGKKLIAYVDGISASAAYGLSVAADEIIINPDSMVGSIGAVVALRDTSEQDKKEGVKTIYISSANSKVPVDADGSFKEEYLQGVQQRVEELGSQFVEHVANLRGIDKNTVKDTEAKMFSSAEAVSLGLADKIMEGEEFYNYLASLTEKHEVSASSKKVQTIKLETHSSIESDLMTDKVDMTTVDVAQLAQLQEQLAEQAKLSEAYAEQLSAYKAKEVEAEKAALSESLSKFEFLAEDNKESLVAFLSNSDVSTEHKALLNSVLDSANLAQAKVKEEAVALQAEAEASVEKVNAEKDSIKEEFGTKEMAETEVPMELSLKEKLAAKVAKSKAAKA